MKCSRSGCKNWSIKGGAVCRVHGGKSPQIARRAAVRYELATWGVDDEKVDASEQLLRLLAQSSRRVSLYSDLLEAEYRSEAELGQAMGASGLKALIGHKFDLTKDGLPVAVEEAIRGLVELEAQERDRCARFAKLAIDAGLEERRVQIEEGQASMVAKILSAALAEVGLADRSDEVLKVVARRLESVA